ncbi:hypothetical protein HanXRQr2_Chr03g0128231 [Helianthus annuus]|uniref:Uncharacterized protein n=1 Tax=Helianthus annuus TaxID=4232 RepID=A0A251VB19_HELAN|nr:hypothetical protein HanXRQr2_Chr03g0128231 [Helianthus annuus]KAJ0945167.1 hypothetical protein HanPSC8_Chr03g0125031 [Helianthus annuus]
MANVQHHSESQIKSVRVESSGTNDESVSFLRIGLSVLTAEGLSQETKRCLSFLC